MERIETTILQNLIFSEEYSRKVIPFIQPDFFEDRKEKIIFEEIVSFIVKYGSSITTEALNIEVENRTDLTDSEAKEIREINQNLKESAVDHQWLLDTTEKWCRGTGGDLSCLMESIHIADGNDEKKNRDAIPNILSDALSVSFDNNIGHDYLLNYEERYEFYHKKKKRLNLISNTLTKLPKAVYLIRLLTSHLLVRVSGNLYSCAMLLAPCCSKGGTYSILQWRWQRRKLLNELMQTY
ncbi:MAG: hypothetical protein CM15mL5_0770 [uncultured marine virus]|nr:MAG: hypothetical protein CM15mL5_0770 [uncultured marine virus]